jgi:hypothetical protein
LINSSTMSGDLGPGSLLREKSFLIPDLKFIFALETGRLVTFRDFGNFAHVKFKTGQLVVNTLTKRELAFGVLGRVGLLKILDVEYAFGNVGRAFLKQALNGRVLVNGFLLVRGELEEGLLFLYGFLLVGLVRPGEADCLRIRPTVSFFHPIFVLIINII